ncbi:hypothetical protein M408DRAFT_14808 [Serendipita vermifera MAFF 305830]|uniref:Translation initiation factor IF-2, mitochondrial n=1 Tax=Serendipita vermifera MAFF 305830 TaxID=933852 RepID=A0A0C3BM67_SERVB|nr:hypothetical protein M408DRAFT_14808 [Serendipita vermifera MAFF 305830]
MGHGSRQDSAPQSSRPDRSSSRQPRGVGGSWDLTGRGSINRATSAQPANPAATFTKPLPRLNSLPRSNAHDRHPFEEPPARLSFVERDRAPPTVETRLNAHEEKERRRREHEYNERTKLGKEKELQRQKTVQQVVKGVAKLSQIRKTRDIFLSKHVSVQHLSRLLGVKMERLQAALKRAGMTEVSYDHLLDSEDAALIAPEFRCNVVIDEVAAFDIYPPPLPADLTTLPHRPPVVTIMGHVDHGKTTLLDKLRSASVAEGEAGGITQHIGAFSLPVSSLSTAKGKDSKDDRIVTFIDTPGHAAFSAMRARGAMVTDVIVLVVAADDGVMPQTKEVIELAKKDQGQVSLVVAINKIDKPGADATTVKQMLLAEGVQLEEFGGDVPAVEVSGLTGQGLDNLMETVSLVAELKDIRAERHGMAVGFVLESKTVKGMGPVATVLLHRGELTTGSHLIAGEVQCRVRNLTDSAGKTIKSAAPGTAVSVAGWKELPTAGDQVLQAAEDEIKRALVNRKRNQALASLVEDVSAINEKRRVERERRGEELEAAKEALTKGQTLPPKPLMRSDIEEQDDGIKYLRLIIKADVSGSAEAVAGALEGIGNDKAKAKILSYSAGNVSEGDVMMAKTTEASIVSFGVNVPRSIAQMAQTEKVPIVNSDIIYRVMETIREKVAGLLPPIIETKVVGEANVQACFDIDLKGRKTLKVAGCRVSNGTLEKNKSARLVRNGTVIHDGQVETLRHMKKEVTEARKGMECGLSLSNYSDNFLPGDTIQMYATITKAAVL